MLVILLTFLICGLTYLYAKSRFKYWKARGVETLEHQHFIFGDISRAIFAQENFIQTIQNVYKEFRSRDCKFGGIYSLNNPMLLITDPEIVKCILVKDADQFMDRGVEYDAKKEPLSAHMFSLNVDDWKFIRKKLSPAFTSGKLKTMFWIIEEQCDVLCKVIERDSDGDICMFNLFERLGMDIIGHSAFGIKCNALENEKSEFLEATSKVFHPTISTVLKVALKYAFKNHANIILTVSSDQKMNEFFLKLVEDTIKYRKDNYIRMNDFLQLLIELMEPSGEDEGLPMHTVAAQSFGFFLAAYETGARSLNMLMYELGKDLKLQDELRTEINDVLEANDGTFSYEIVKNCKLLEAIVKEALRKHPPVVVLNRICNKDYKVPGTTLVIEKGMPIIIPAYSFHQDPEYFPNPEKFDPRRFFKQNERNVKPFTYMPLGDGPRYCIGNRLGLHQVKTSVMKIIKNFEITVSPKTEEPLTFNPITENLLLGYKQKIYFNVKKLY